MSVADRARRPPTSSCRRSPWRRRASATIPGGRAEVVYLDVRVTAGYRPYLTAFAQFSATPAPTRGGNRSLDPAAHPVPGAGVGNRLAVLATRAEPGVAPSGPAFAWWPNTNNGTSDPVKLYRSRVNHGAEAPVLPNGTVGTSKNVAVAIPDLFAATDGDGDPVRVSIIAAPGAREHPGHHVHPVARIRRRRRDDAARRRRPAARRHAAADRHRQRRPDAGRRQDAAAGPAGRQRVAPAQGDRRGLERPAALRARAARCRRSSRAAW